MKIIYLLLFISFSAFSFEVSRNENGFPLCIQDKESKKVYSLKYVDDYLTRKIMISENYDFCAVKEREVLDRSIQWTQLKEKQLNFLPQSIQEELRQIENKSFKFRTEKTAKEYILINNIQEYTLALNRELSRDYGQLFSAQVFKEVIESKPKNIKFRNTLINNLNQAKVIGDKYNSLKDVVTIVVSFGLGWEEKYNRTTPYYLKDFISDIKSVGLPVVFLKRNAFGRVEDNVNKITPQVESLLHSGKKIIFVSLCKGTPELLAAEANINRQDGIFKRGNILGHVNLSGMLGGAFFSDYSNDVILPKLVGPILKYIPNESASDSGKMVEAIEFMKNSIIEETIHKSLPYLENGRLYINVTGAPLSTQVLNNGSPMIPILKYNLKKKFIEGASDGFLELPKTLVPESISTNQLTLVLDSSHMLSDGVLEGFRIDDQKNRRILYGTIIDEILKANKLEMRESD